MSGKQDERSANSSEMDITPDEQQLWEGIGGHFESFTQMLCEFIDNSLSNFDSEDFTHPRVWVELEELDDGSVKVAVEDEGGGIDDLEPALRLGDTSVGDGPLNEHGFGLKHALASADPDNSSWTISTQTTEDEGSTCRQVKAPYKFDMTQETLSEWPGDHSGTGTLVEFEATETFFDTIQEGISGKAGFETSLGYLAEDLGFTYASVIEDNRLEISIHSEGTKHRVEPVMPDWQGHYHPGSGAEQKDLGSGQVEIEYQFGEIEESEYKRYYKRNMSTSGVEIRINGRLMTDNIFPEIWGKERHNKYNHFLAIINLKSDDLELLPQTTTSKNDMQHGDEKLSSLFDWIHQIFPKVPPETTEELSERELVRKLRDQKATNSPGTLTALCEFDVYEKIGSEVPADMYTSDGKTTTLYEAKKYKAGVQSLYQLLMYWDGAVWDELKPNEGVLIASEFSEGVPGLLERINEMRDSGGTSTISLPNGGARKVSITRQRSSRGDQSSGEDD